MKFKNEFFKWRSFWLKDGCQIRFWKTLGLIIDHYVNNILYYIILLEGNKTQWLKSWDQYHLICLSIGQLLGIN
jgi:hypothetical protein